jgi:DNA-directed RNA polymerase specialized sigma24 family protein
MTLRYEAEMSYDEIGRAVGLAPGHVGVAIHRAKLRLRSALADFQRTRSS